MLYNESEIIGISIVELVKAADIRLAFDFIWLLINIAYGVDLFDMSVYYWRFCIPQSKKARAPGGLLCQRVSLEREELKWRIIPSHIARASVF